MKAELIELLKEKNALMENFKTATLSCLTNVRDINDDIERAEKYMSYIDDRQAAVNAISEISDKIKNSNLNELFESDTDEEILSLKKSYNDILESLKIYQKEMNTLGMAIKDEMRKEFKKVKQSQSFNNIYFNSPYTSGTKFDAKQ